jgi:hypothetical protein
MKSDQKMHHKTMKPCSTDYLTGSPELKPEISSLEVEKHEDKEPVLSKIDPLARCPALGLVFSPTMLSNLTNIELDSLGQSIQVKSREVEAQELDIKTLLVSEFQRKRKALSIQEEVLSSRLEKIHTVFKSRLRNNLLLLEETKNQRTIVEPQPLSLIESSSSSSYITSVISVYTTPLPVLTWRSLNETDWKTYNELCSRFTGEFVAVWSAKEMDDQRKCSQLSRQLAPYGLDLPILCVDEWYNANFLPLHESCRIAFLFGRAIRIQRIKEDTFLISTHCFKEDNELGEHTIKPGECLRVGCTFAFVCPLPDPKPQLRPLRIDSLSK